MVFFLLGFGISYLFWKIVSGKYEGDKIEKSLRFSTGKYFVHVHHWMMGFVLLVALIFFGKISYFVFGILLGTIIQGIFYKDRFVFIYKIDDFENIYEKWKPK